jgi:cytochrome c551/c552
MLLNGHVRRAAAVAVLAFAGLAFEVARQHVIQTEAIADRLALVQMDADRAFTTLQQAQEARYPSNTPLGAEAGAKIYSERCLVCHSFNQKVVGPAHKDVLPKYRGQPEKLVAFILNPTKVDPAFPAMTAPGLSRREAVAVAEYLLKRIDEETKGATP